MFIPSLTHETGAVLTVSDWASIDVKLASCDLSDLLLKPGIEVLKQINNLKTYWHWPGELVLNARTLLNNVAEQCVIRSKYDGKILTFTYEQILSLIQHLSPDYVALPAYLVSLTEQAYPDILMKSVEYDENNKSGTDALQGLIYTSSNQNMLCITDKKYAMDFSVMDESCACPACADGFTRAYFHHLYVHTPLLCQRWLVMHNQWMTNQMFV